MSQPAYSTWTADNCWPTQHRGTAMGGGFPEMSQPTDDQWIADGYCRPGYWGTENGGISVGGCDVEGVATARDIEGSTAASSSTDEQWFNERITDEMRLDPLFPEKLLAHQTRTCRPCIYYYLKEDSCRNGVSCDHCHICSPEEAKTQKRQAQREARAAARRNDADRKGGPRPRRRNHHGIPDSWMQALENGTPPEDLPGRTDASAVERPSQESESPEAWLGEIPGSSDNVKPNIIPELLENTTHLIDTSHPKKWLCEACNETVLIAQGRNLVAFLSRPCQPGPPPWMHPSHEYTRDVGKILCSVCFGFSNGIRVSPKLKKPCLGPCEVVSNKLLLVTQPRSRVVRTWP
eukprot:TRINITY_DN19629_c0_g1_i1.p1 TRINITY_DN19629_c0_g1~~TRINITY_DN19629_c0_g1_i1.p1  ORF type:complete len:349 (-),score=42.33 TRINITY_DN19629_c0_g1_i1:141-1187(-)